MVRSGPVRFEAGGVTVEQRSLPSGFSARAALKANYVIMHLANAATVEGVLNEDRYSRRVVAGDLHILPAGARVESHVFDPCQLLLIVFSNAFLSGNADDSVEIRQCVLRPYLALRDLHLQNLLAAVLEECQLGCPAGSIYLEGLIRTLVRYLARRYSNLAAGCVHSAPDGLPPNRLRTVLDYIHAHLDGELTLTQLAGLVQMSPQHFANLFRKSTRFSPHQYILHERLTSAKKLLVETPRPIAEVALETGFSSQSHLTDTFHKMMGFTPMRYRRWFSNSEPRKPKSEPSDLLAS
jgi:AraC family transcriptional regulator